jgi:alpha-L-fucosidase
MAIQAVLLLFGGLCSQFTAEHGATLPAFPSRALPLDNLFNNKAATTTSDGHRSIADFDGDGNAYDTQFLPTGSWVYDGLNVRFRAVDQTRLGTIAHS